MISIPISGLENSLIILLVALWAVLLFGGLVFGRATAQRNYRMPLWTRLASSFVLTILGWIIFISAQGTTITTMVFWVAIGMSCGLLGDLFMGQVIPVKQYVLFAIAAFGGGHIAYMIGMANTGQHIGAATPGYIQLAFWWMLGTIGWFIAVFRGAKPTLLHYATLPYALLLASTAAFASNLAILDHVFVPMLIGAIFFLISDLLLAGGLFSGLRLPYFDDIIWLTYGPAQMLIVAGAFVLARMAGTV